MARKIVYNKLVAEASVTIKAPIKNVWEAFIKPELIKKYMFGTEVITDWKEGSEIRWKGEWNGKAYSDKGEILQKKPRKFLQYSHFSPLSGRPDKRENYHVVSVKFQELPSGVNVSLTQDNNVTEEEREHSQKNWETVLTSVKQLLEK